MLPRISYSNICRHALGNRARKAGQGILTVRFEMPFAVWCGHCPKPTIIGQGVRFNAEKRKVGAYHSTPIWAFRMKHVACGGWIEIRTDPANTDYVVYDGGKRRDTGEDKVREGDVEIRTEDERRRLQEDAFAALEVKIDDRAQVNADKARIEDLKKTQTREKEEEKEKRKQEMLNEMMSKIDMVSCPVLLLGLKLIRRGVRCSTRPERSFDKS